MKTNRLEELGRVIDTESHIYCQKGVTYQYVLGEGCKEIPPAAFSPDPVVPETERLILDFGDAWFLQEYLSRQLFCSSIQSTLPDESDTLLALIFYWLLTNRGASCHARIWYEGNYLYLAFPHENLTGENISRVLEKLGRGEVQCHFLKNICLPSMEIAELLESLWIALECQMPRRWTSHRSATRTVI